MGFFEQQDKARRYTKKLVGLFALAVIGIIILLNSAILFSLCLSNITCMSLETYIYSSWFIWVSLSTLIIIGVTSLIRWQQLKRGGGFKTIMMVGATKIPFDTNDLKLKQLINIVEEMSIAAGISMPHLFIMEEEAAINAFVAGTESHNTCLCVTRGAVEKLSRQELQGVIAHEYSHIFNGDMRLNIYLMGVLAGILVIGQLGEFFINTRRVSTGSRSRNSGQVAIVGLALIVVGYLGLFFGRLIKAGISRQREFLADASAVQYTRETSGIAGALYKIKTEADGSLLLNASAEEVSHMCFERSHKITWFSNMLATHPPLQDRINSIDPKFQPSQKSAAQQGNEQKEEISQANKTSTGFQNATGGPLATALLLSVGQLNSASVDTIHHQLEQLPNHLKDIARDQKQNLTSADILLATMICQNSLENEQLFKLLSKEESYNNLDELIKLVSKLSTQTIKQQILLFDIALARFAEYPKEEQQHITRQLKMLADIDKKVTPIEYVLFALANHTVSGNKPIEKTIGQYSTVIGDITYLLGSLLRLTDMNADDQESTLSELIASFGKTQDISVPENFNANQFHGCLKRLARLNPLLKKPLLEAMLQCIDYDNKQQATEQRNRNLIILRSICSILDCPVPEQ